MRSFWRDETGAVLSTELVLVGTLLTVGLISGVEYARQTLVNEFIGLGNAIQSLDQSFSVSPISTGSAYTAGSSYNDVRQDQQKPIEVIGNAR